MIRGLLFPHSVEDHSESESLRHHYVNLIRLSVRQVAAIYLTEVFLILQWQRIFQFYDGSKC